MSTVVDNRIVSMEFNNARFEKNVRQTIESIEDLKESLEFEDSVKGFTAISDSAKKVDLSPINRSIDTITEKFSALEIAAKATIANITVTIEREVSKWGKKLTIEMPQLGYNKYDAQIGSMQTLVNATGKSVTELESTLEKLQWFSDETSYSFDEMMTALQTMSSSGGDLNKSIDLMMGLANATAFAGQGAQSFVIASRNLTQSYSQGYLNYQDWKSIQLAKVNSKELIQTLIDVGVELGKIKEGEVTVANFATTLKDKWADVSVMEQAFGRFAEISNKAYELVEAGEVDNASQAYALLKDEFDGIYYKAAKAAQEAKTFKEVMDATKDALSSTWSQTFNMIVGNYEEAKALWSGVVEIMYDAFVEPRNEINKTLREWKDIGGRTKLIEALSNALANLSRISQTVKSAFREVFPRKTAEELYALTENLNKLTQRLMLSDLTLAAIHSSIKSTLKLIKSVSGALMSLLHAIFPVTKAFGSLGEMISYIVIGISVLIEKIADFISKGSIVQGIVTVISFLLQGITGVVVLLASSIATLFSKISSANFPFLQKALSVIKFVLSGIALAIGAIVSSIIFLIDRVKALFIMLKNSGFMSTIGNGLLYVISAIKAGFTTMVGAILLAVDAVKKFILSIKELSFSDKIKAIAESFGKVKDKILSIFTNKDMSGADGMFKTSEEGGRSFRDVLTDIINKLNEFRKSLTIGKVVAIGFSVAFLGVAGSVSKMMGNVSTLVGNASNLLKTFKNVLAKTSVKTAGIFNVAKAIALLAGSLYLLSSVPVKQLWMMVGALGAILTAATVSSILVDKLTRAGKFLDSGFTRILVGISTLGVAMIGIAAALKILSTIKNPSNLIPMLGTIILALMGIAATAALIDEIPALGGNKGNILRMSVMILSLSLAMINISKALSIVGSLDVSSIKQAEATLLPLLVGFGAFAMGLGNIRIGTFVGVLGTFLVLKAAVPVIAEIVESVGNIPVNIVDKFAEYIKDKLVIFMSALAGLLIMMAVLGKNIGQAGQGIAKFVGSVGLLSALFVGLSIVVQKMNEQNLVGLESIIGAALVIAGSITSIGFIVLALKEFPTLNKDQKSVDFAKVAKAVSKMILSVTVMMGAAALFAHLTKGFTLKQFIVAEAALTMMWASLGVIGQVIAKIGNIKNGDKIGKSVAALMYALAGIITGMVILTGMQDIKGTMHAAMAISMVLLSLSAVFASISAAMSKIYNSKKGGGNAAAAVLLLGELTIFASAAMYFMAKMKDVNPKSLIASGGAIALAMTGVAIAFGAIASTISKIENKGKVFLGSILLGELTVIIVGIAHIFKSLENTDVSGIGTKALAIAGVLGTLGIVFAIIGRFSENISAGSGWGTAGILVGLSAVILAIGSVLTEMSLYPWENIIASAGSMAIALGAVAVAITGVGLLSKVVGIGGIWAGAGSIALVLLSLGGAMLMLAGACNILAAAFNAVNVTYGQFAANTTSSMEKSGQYAGIGFTNGIKKSLNLVAKATGGMGDVAISSFNNELDIHSPSLETFKSGIYYAQGFINACKEKLKDFWNIGKAMGSTVLQAFKGEISWSEAFSSIKDTFASSFDFSIESLGISSITDTVSDVMSSITSEVSESLQNMGLDVDGLANSYDGLTTSAEETKSTFEKLSDTISGQMDLLKGFDFTADISSETMLKNMSDSILGVTEWSNDMAMLAARGMSEGLLQKLGDLGPQGYKYVKAFVSMTDEEIQNANSMWGMSLKLPSYAAEEVEASYKYAGELATKGFSNALDKYQSMLDAYSIGELTMEQIQSALQDYTPKVVSTVKTVTSTIVDEASDDAEAAGEEIGTEIGTGIRTSLSDEINSIDGDLQAWAKSVSDKFSKDKDNQRWYSYFGLDSMGKISSSFADFYAKSYDIFSAINEGNALLRTKEGTELYHVYNEFLRIGDYAFEGLNNSFINNEAQMIATIGKFADLLPLTVRQRLGIASPSKVMYELGGYVVDGLVNAITDGDSSVVKASDEIADSLTTTMKNASKEINDYLSSDEGFNPVITPVLDLTNIQNGASNINDLLSSRNAIRTSAAYNENVNHAISLADINSAARLSDIIAACTATVVNAIQNNQPIIENHLHPEADPSRIFKTMQVETRKFIRANGYNPLV